MTTSRGVKLGVFGFIRDGKTTYCCGVNQRVRNCFGSKGTGLPALAPFSITDGAGGPTGFEGGIPVIFGKGFGDLPILTFTGRRCWRKMPRRA